VKGILGTKRAGSLEAGSVDKLSVGAFVGVVADPGSKPSRSNII